jgi:hypothetical protein
MSLHVHLKSRFGAAFGACVIGGMASVSSGQVLHDVDFLIRVAGGALETGSLDAGGAPVFPGRVRSGVFGAEGIANFTNDPGVNASLGALVPGMSVGFDLVGALRSWDGTFDVISEDTITVRKSGINTVTPPVDSVVPGIVFGQADLDDGAGFHHHVQFILNPAMGGAPSGVWLLSWELWTDAPGVARTEPVYVVFAQGAGAAELDDAVAWVEDNLIGSACVADVAEPIGVLNFFDVSGFIAAFNAQEASADLAAPFGAWNFFDVSAFIAAYNAGCP